GRPAQRCRLVPGVRPGRRPLAFQGGGCRCGGCCLREGQGRVEEGRPQEGWARPVVHSWWGVVTRHPTARPSSPIGRGGRLKICSVWVRVPGGPLSGGV